MASQLIANYRSCTWRCRSQRHVDQLASTITKSSSISNDQLKIYIALTCPNALRSIDQLGGRSLVHWAASCGNRTEILEWLLDDFGADIDLRDSESGYTPLHRALLHGQLASAQALIDRDASMTILDREGLSPLDIVRRDQGIGVQAFTAMCLYNQSSDVERFSLKGPTEVYSCGENVTSNLGHRVPTERSVPDLIDYFSRRAISIRKVAMSKWHTAFLTADGTLFTCGHGSNGRLGHGDTNDRTVPVAVQISNDTCVNVAVGDEHTIAITANGSAWAWGGNRRRQLGLYSTAEMVLTPQQIMLNKNAKDITFCGCSCSNSYTILWTNSFVYCCGANDGQFGRCATKDESDIYPLRQLIGVASPFIGADILDIACGEVAIAILTKKFDVVLLHKYESRRILSRLLNFTHVFMNPGKVKKSEGQQQLQQPRGASLVRLTLFSEGGFVFYWDTEDQHLRQCTFRGGVTKTIYPRNACAFGDDGLFLITDDGKLYKGRIGRLAILDAGDVKATEESEKARKSATPGKDEKRFSKKATTSKSQSNVEAGKVMSKKAATTTDFKWTSRKLVSKAATGLASIDGHSPMDPVAYQSIILSSPIQAVHRAIAVSSTSDGRNFCVVQQDPKLDLVELPSKSASTLADDYRALLEDARVEDCLHDVQVRTGENGAPLRALHKFILCSRCPYFSKRIQTSTTQLQIEEPAHVVTEFALSRILDYIYTDDCDLFHGGPLIPADTDYDHIGNGDTADRRRQKTRDPVREVLDASKRLNIKSLTKRLEMLRWDPATKTVVQATRYYSGSQQRLRFEPNAFPELCDVRLQCKDGVKISAHRCVLSSRAEYFRCMFASGFWSETNRNQILKVDADSDVLTPVLHYLYTDELPVYTGAEKKTRGSDKDLYATADKEMLEHYGKILVCADQWLLERLRQLCEMELAARITFRNAADMLEFADAINAHQLFATCAQFISLNLCALLEANALRHLSMDCLRRVGAFYREFYPHVAHRAVTPSSDPPSVSEIEAVWNDVVASGISSDDLIDEFVETWTQAQAAGGSPSAVSAKKKRTGAATTPRARRTSATVAISTGRATENQQDTSESAAKKSERAIKKTPLAISTAANAIPAQEQKATWTKGNSKTEPVPDGQSPCRPGAVSKPISVPSAGKLPSRSRNKPWNVVLSPTEFPPEVSLRDLMQAEEEKQATIDAESRKSIFNTAVQQRSSVGDPKSPPAQPASRVRSPLSAWISPSGQGSAAPAQVSTATSPPRSAWASTSPPSVEIARTLTAASIGQIFPPPLSCLQNKPSVKTGGNRTFDEIVKEEKLKEAAMTRILNKPLKIIQDEELAMQELSLIYQVDDEWDELVTVERAVAVVSEPIWQAHVGSPPRF